MRTALRIQALVCNAQPLHWPSAYQMLRHNLVGIFRLHIPIPDRLGIHHHRWTMLALIQAARLVDPYPAAQPGFFGQLIQPRMQFALSIGCA